MEIQRHTHTQKEGGTRRGAGRKEGRRVEERDLESASN